MRPILLMLPHGSAVIGEILSDYSSAPERLSNDILQVSLPSGIVIQVGWHPRFDPTGCFRIVVVEGDWDNPRIPPIAVDDPFDAANMVRTLAEQYAYQSGETEQVKTVSYAGEVDYEAYAPPQQIAVLV